MLKTTYIKYIFPILTLIFLGCGAGSQQKMIEEMVEKYIRAIDKGDDILAMECVLDYDKFIILYPNLGTETRSRADEIIGALETSTGRLFNKFAGMDVKMKKFTLGSFWDQFKGHPGFHGTKVKLVADNQEYEIIFDKIIRVADGWYIYEIGNVD